METEPVIVQALFAFKGSNNDELCFHKGDLITVTQREDGGWWEGTLGEKTGWFPSNYVREVKDANIAQLVSVQHDAANLSIVYQDLLDSEKAHLAEQQGLVSNFLTPLERSTILTLDEYKQLIGNFMEVLDTHRELLKLVEDELLKPHKEQRIGKQFLNLAQKMKTVHQAYCSLHPKAVCILDKYRDELSQYMESCGANTPGVLVLTTGLSKPFRRLAKYSGMLLEVERHVEDNHPDRGDIQRSVAVYKEMDATCAATRRQKELETQVLTGPVRGWEGVSLSTLGDIIYMGSVAVGPQHLDRYLVLFPSTLLILSISHRLSAFIYEGKLPVTGITVLRLDDNDQYKNAFEISGPMIEKVTAVCQSKDEANHWVEILRKYNPARATIPNNNHKMLPSTVEIVPQPPPHLNQRGYSTRTSIIMYTPNYDYTPTFPSQYYPPTAPYAGLTKYYHFLMKQKVITKTLLKLLLYPEYMKSFRTADVKRRQHRSECFFMKKGSTCSGSDTDSSNSSDSSSDLDSSSGGDKPRSTGSKICRQDAVEIDSSDDESQSSNPFGYIRYYNPQTGSRTEGESSSVTDDWRSRTKVVPPRESKKPSIVLTSSVRLELSNHPSEVSVCSLCPDEDSADDKRSNIKLCVYENDDKLGVNNKHSIVIHHNSIALSSRGSKVDDGKSNVDDTRGSSVLRKSSIHTVLQTNTQHLSADLGVNQRLIPKLQLTQKRSEDSDASSYVTPNYACENLAQLNGSFEIGTNELSVTDTYAPTTRQSCPNKLVADKFNESSLTTLYIPPYQSCSDNNLAYTLKDVASTTSNSSCSTTTHSSSLDLPVNVLPIPDAMLAELLYNFDSELESELELEVPDEAKSVIKPPPMFESESGGGKPKVLRLNNVNIGFRKHSLNSDKNFKRRSSIQMSSDLLEDGYKMLHKHLGRHGKYCSCCTEPTHSPRSSDSGMAGSCTLNSPDFPHQRCSSDINDLMYKNCKSERNVVSLMEPEAYESQCRCTSPFDSTPRTSANIVADSVHTSFSSSELPPVPTPWQSVTQIHSKITNLRTTSSCIQQSKSMSAIVEPKLKESDSGKTETYRSGLYAHWWLKAKVPVAVVKGIYEETRNTKAALVATPSSNRTGGTISSMRTITPPSRGTLNNNRSWSACCLRPAPPLRPCTALTGTQNGSPVRPNRKPVSFKDDALILEVIEAYFFSVQSRNTVNSVNMQTDGNKIHKDNENMNETLKVLLNKMKNIECNLELLTNQLSEERAARCSLQSIMKKHLTSSCKDMDSIDWPTVESNILT